ncbi:mechanosensitive ion channel [Erythrobacter sp. LQ02-29]|uniref:mechanosensitive ion channel family protein n=1 Tax=Erythrobacter sp. LQ02-29 TaxID=2920384 RepID=UPI001F4EB57C|nr:mechanosensitive ion channel family protein [Erythrobacter sp. LQ02-29]MCP9221547.1 mechanosensitive ion channel [Erythrobacter sp. LQ02-29]
MGSRSILKTFLSALAALVAVVTLPGIASAQLPTASASPTPTVAAPAIDTSTDPNTDTRIAQRLRGIFGELPAYTNVQLRVSDGVVTLSGSVADAADIDRAEAIASRVEGVVTVENGLTRDASLGEGLNAIGALSGKLRGLVNMLPLIGLALAVALLIAMVGYLLGGFGRLWHRIAPNGFLAELIGSAVRFVFVLLGIVVALDMVGAGALLGAVLGGAGVIGIALGFAMRDLIENYVASIMLSVRQPFRANDHVLIDDLEGRVIRLTSRATVLMTLDGNHLRIPNSTVFKAVIVNYTRNPQRRFDFALGVDADDDPRAARRLGRDTLAGLPFVLADPAPEARIEEVGDSNIVIRFLAWIDQTEADFFKARSNAIPAVKDALEAAGFGLPEPIYRLRFDPRSAKLPLETEAMAETTSAATIPPPVSPAPKPAAHPDEDVTPADEIAGMVAAERRAETKDKDLLDSGRPIE